MSLLDRMHLTIIQEVIREGSLTAAAKKLNLSQPALSHAIAKLEAQLGVDIWRREGRGLQLSPAGEALLALANRLLPQFAHAEDRLRQISTGQQGKLRIGMECHPCYQWLLKIVAPYLDLWPQVDVDVRQKFQFSGIDALLGHEIDMLVTPDPAFKTGLRFTPVFDYEQVLVVGDSHPLRHADFVLPQQLAGETLITYPVPVDRLDVYNEFLHPAGITPRHHKPIETTDIMLLMVAHGRGVAALPRWLVEEDYSQRLKLHPIRLGPNGIAKQIFLGQREDDTNINYMRGFIELAQDLPARQKRTI